MEVIKKYKSQIIFHLLLNIIIGVFISLSSYYHTPLKGGKDYLVYFIHFTILQFTIFGFTYWITLNKWMYRIVFSSLFILFSSISFWTYTQDIIVSESLIHAILDTKLDIAIDLISFQLIIFEVVIFTIVYFLIIAHQKINSFQIKSPFTIIALVACATFFIGEDYKYGIFRYRAPYNIYSATQNYLKKSNLALDSIETKLTTNDEDLNIIFVLGETVRADHLGLNGYSRNTTPLLSKRKNIISYPNIYTNLTYTAVSVPQILTNKSIFNTQRMDKSYSIYSVLNQTKYTTYWIGNQTPEKSFSKLINQNKKVEIIDPYRSVFSYHKKHDIELLQPFKSSFKISKNQFFTIHMIGSHWYYESRYPESFKIYKPTTNSKYIPSTTDEQMINSYDNTLHYLDFVLNELISTIEDTNSVIIYLSDHGEILGENGKWLHAQESKASTNPAMIVWYSDIFKTSHPKLVKNLTSNSQKKITTDFLYHSILDLISVKNTKFDKNQSIFSSNTVFKTEQ